MARTDQSRDWRVRLAPSSEELESLGIEALSRLPEKFRRLCNNLKIYVADFPEERIVEDIGLDSPFELLGLLEEGWSGEDFLVKSVNENGKRITLFRRPILDYWSENEESLGDIISHILIYEIGHHYGLSDEDLEAVIEEF